MERLTGKSELRRRCT